MSKSVSVHAYDAALGTTPTKVLEANSQLDWLEIENRAVAGDLLFYWLTPDPDGIIVEPPADADAWHSISAATGRVSPFRTAEFWVRALSGTVHYVLTAG